MAARIFLSKPIIDIRRLYIYYIQRYRDTKSKIYHIYIVFFGF
ncbi:hypothetical protein CLOSTHATH_03834 [Hungatella hathewayi DSM 13479]|uniref:Uncharacterized protein n=1 Tax=Hungatella hathewayi DSM 13479 TaxID=566550 RepID=D3AJP3_9FIRM|nr:hypothetical protein CLOSTHATH_03834 [Hungatella hathewayi DSM 13479]